MTRIAALKKLLAKVEAGDDKGFRSANRAVFSTPCQDMDLQSIEEHSHHAYRGSLDAAKALHDAVLPGWDWSGYYCGSTTTAFEYQLETEAMRQSLYFEPVSGSSNHNPSRAWLIAILKVLISQEAAP